MAVVFDDHESQSCLGDLGLCEQRAGDRRAHADSNSGENLAGDGGQIDMGGDLCRRDADGAGDVDVDFFHFAHAGDGQQRDRKESGDGADGELGVYVDAQEQNENGKDDDLRHHRGVEYQWLDDFHPALLAAPEDS